MPNTLGGINLAQIAQETLKALLLEFLPLNAFTTDFNKEIKDRGESVTTRIPTAVSAQDLASGYTTSAVASTAKTVTLNKFKGFVYGFTDAEVSKAGDPKFLKDIWITPAVSATLEAMMDDLLALVLNAAFSSNTVLTAANCDADALATQAQLLSTANVMKQGRFALLAPTYIESLVKDNAIQNFAAFGDRSPVVDNHVQRVHGFDIYEYNDIPANGENLAGIVGNRNALLIAARQPAIPQHFMGDIENVVDPVTGLPLQFRAWYDHEAGETKVSVGVLYGVATGVGGAIRRLKSA